eukprot:gnl/MRDRNA2_/MRDRNA2_434033_c0_seq1.p1 gnl/MRDRNA2_/MRDRNA2_434033_c0~~gnl/MRDRNA2_/MRDRNA2_434033_c0_seq1.p1  ORF type:complete len:106 (-),score=18.48 gnl/MRDRNA2_/MRDRNA2_434033_c0_seq1:21-338(-)
MQKRLRKTRRRTIQRSPSIAHGNVASAGNKDKGNGDHENKQKRRSSKFQRPKFKMYTLEGQNSQSHDSTFHADLADNSSFIDDFHQERLAMWPSESSQLPSSSSD